MNREEIRLHMAEHYHGFVLVEPPNPDELDFIKYEHLSGDMTLLAFMLHDGTCSFTRLMVDMDYIDNFLKKYDNDYLPDGEKSWLAARGADRFVVKMEESEWFFTVTVRKIGDLQ